MDGYGEIKSPLNFKGTAIPVDMEAITNFMVKHGLQSISVYFMGFMSNYVLTDGKAKEL